VHSITNGTHISLSTINLTLGIRYCRHDYYRSLRCERIRHLLLSQGTAGELFRRGPIVAIVGEPFNQSIALYSSTDAMHVPKRNSPPCIFVHCMFVHTFTQVVVCTLASQAVDSNVLLGASTLSYKAHYWDGVVFPLGIGLSLINNAIWLARHINHDFALTLPDVLSKRYGKVVEVLVSIFCCISFLCLLAGNLVGMGAVISYLISISLEGAIWVSQLLILLFVTPRQFNFMNTS